MKQLYIEKEIEIPENVKLSVKNKAVTVEGPKGTLTRNFENVDFDINKKGKKVLIRAYYINFFFCYPFLKRKIISDF